MVNVVSIAVTIVVVVTAWQALHKASDEQINVVAIKIAIEIDVRWAGG